MIDEKNKQITAYHESGHAIVAYYTKDAMPINKATIMPRGGTLGHVSTSLLPSVTRTTQSALPLVCLSLRSRCSVSYLLKDGNAASLRAKKKSEYKDVNMQKH